MTFKTTKLRDAIVFALVVGATSITGTGAAFAQAAPPPGPEGTAATELDRITVTGTRIQSQTVTASSPVTEIEQEEFQYSGATRSEDLVNQYPQLSPAFDSFQNNGALGYPTVNLRGLGSARTLTLVNGKRLAPGASEVPDISIVPSFLIRRVDILTGGASAVYGSDAVGGVVNFILDTDFEGVKLTVGASGYQHKNDNEYIQELQNRRNFPFPTGSGVDGRAENVDVAVGGRFDDGRGHAMAWFGWRKNDALFHGDRDYSSCALSAAGTSCGGSGTNATGSFFFYQPDTGRFLDASFRPDGTFKRGFNDPYNYAPINYYQRPDERYTFGSSVKYEINEHFKPYLETMFINKKSAIQVAPSGVFFSPTLFDVDCADPLIRTACADLGLNPAAGLLNVYVGKRNTEGDALVPRNFQDDTSQFRVVSGVQGAIDENWSYDAYLTYGQTRSTTVGNGDFLKDRIEPALRGCPSGSYSGCIPFNVFNPGGVTAEAAANLAGTSILDTSTEATSVTAFITGDTGYGLPWANGENVSVVVGGAWGEEKIDFTADSNSQRGNFAGAGGPSIPVNGKISVQELFGEALVPLVRGLGFLRALDLDLGYRLSDYNFAGRAETFKVGFTSDFGLFRARGGYNRAIRAPGIGALFSQQQIALFGGEDPCAGATPRFTRAQCANTGVTAAQYGNIAPSPASQYNQFVGGNLDLRPEKADTYTLGFVVTPTNNLRLSLDYYDIEITDTIATIGAQTILNFCGLTGDPFLCNRVRRSGSGDLWIGSDPNVSGNVVNLIDNFGERRVRGLDLSAFYSWDMIGGRFLTSFQGNRVLENKFAPLVGVNDDATYDCKGKFNIQCQTPEWRHIANIRYSRDWASVNLRWRYFGEMDYIDQNGVPLFTDKLLCSTGGGTAAGFATCLGNQKLRAYNYIDLSASALIGTWGEFTVGVNNIADKEPPLVGAGLATNANAPGGYDQAGRFIFTSFTVKF